MGTVVLAIDGLGGAGKSTLAARVSEQLDGAPIVHIDDFETADDWLNGWPRLLEQVLQPLADGRAARFQRYDWDRARLAEWHELPAAGLLLLEGVGSSRREFRAYLGASVWVATSQSERLRRGLERDGTEARAQWLRWQAAEDAYLARDHPDRFADLIVSGEHGEPWRGPGRPDDEPHTCTEIVHAVHERPAPMIPAVHGLQDEPVAVNRPADGPPPGGRS
jgi:uridine kinase